ncbi:hypothetical protein ACN6LM_001526 [Streptomyces sp. SAS_281]|uniref:hypothetical protein n=1 Tax=Streptomyces sp. SAS_281 TaxID=3412744 RepID=UPI00403CAA34
MTSDRPRTSISAWRPPVPGISEVFRAHFTGHAYPTTPVAPARATDPTLDARKRAEKERHGCPEPCGKADR